MAWGKLDDGYHENPKMLRVGIPATGLHARAISYCARHETDGHIPATWVAGQLVEFKPTEQARIVRALVDVGLFEQHNGGFVVNDYLDYNPSKAELDARRAKEAERKRRNGGKDA